MWCKNRCTHPCVQLWCVSFVFLSSPFSTWRISKRKKKWYVALREHGVTFQCSISNELRSHRKHCICLQICSVILHKYRVPLRNFAFTHLKCYFHDKRFASECKVSLDTWKICERMQRFLRDYIIKIVTFPIAVSLSGLWKSVHKTHPKWRCMKNVK